MLTWYGELTLAYADRLWSETDLNQIHVPKNIQHCCSFDIRIIQNGILIKTIQCDIRDVKEPGNSHQIYVISFLSHTVLSVLINFSADSRTVPSPTSDDKRQLAAHLIAKFPALRLKDDVEGTNYVSEIIEYGEKLRKNLTSVTLELQCNKWQCGLGTKWEQRYTSWPPPYYLQFNCFGPFWPLYS